MTTITCSIWPRILDMLTLTGWSGGFILAQMHFPVEFCAVYILDFLQREARMQELTQEMTVRDALPFLSPAQQLNLQPWADEFGIQLREFHIGQIKTYENLRLRVISREVVNAEVSTLLGLLDSVGAGDEIRKFRCENQMSFPRKRERPFPSAH